MCEPFARRRFLVIDLHSRLKIQNHGFGPANLMYRQNRCARHIRRRVGKNKINVGFGEEAAGLMAALRIIDEAEVHDLGTQLHQLLLNKRTVADQALSQSFELRPIGFQPHRI